MEWSTSGSRSAGRAWLGVVERLEARTCLSVAIQFNYSQDVLGFFSDSSRRALLQRAADTIGSRLNDHLLAIVPRGSDSWTAITTNPGTGAGLSVENLSVPANTLIIYAGAMPLVSSTLGVGGPGGWHGTGAQSWLRLIEGRGQDGALTKPPTDTSPWGGSITFNSSSGWYFGVDPAGNRSNQADFFSVALHELCHVLGFGMSVWQGLVSGGAFQGPAATAEYNRGGAAPPVSGSHWAQGLADDSQEVAMDPTLTLGDRKLMTRLDFAALQDIGWQVTSDLDGTISSALNSGLTTGTMRTFSAKELDSATDVDLYRFNARSKDVFEARTFVVDGGTAVDLVLRLFDAQGNELAAAKSTTSDGLSFTIKTDGTYYLGVSAGANRYYSATASPSRLIAGPAGNYTLTLGLNQDVDAPQPSPPVPAPSPPTPAPAPSPTPAPPPTPAPAPPDTTPPRVVGVQVGSILARSNPKARAQRVTVIFVSLSEAVDPASVSNPAAYQLIGGRTIRRQGLVFNRRIAIRRVDYLAGSRRLTLFPGQGFTARQRFQLVIPQAAGVRDPAGNPLDGDRDGQPGGDFRFQT